VPQRKRGIIMGIKKFVLNEKMTLTEEQRKKIKEASNYKKSKSPW
jgi:hypothetical protein